MAITSKTHKFAAGTSRARRLKTPNSQTLKQGCANQQKIRETIFVYPEKTNGPKLDQLCEMAFWNWSTCLVGLQSAEYAD